MSIPREGSRDTGEGIIVSVTPDVCKTPVGNSMVPIPYSITAKQGDDANTVATVRMTGKRAHNMASLVTKCTGDQPGTGTGVKSGTVGSVCHPKTHSGTVRIRGEYAIRHGDMWEMNNRNTLGKLTYVRTSESFEETPAIVLTQNRLLEAPDTSDIEARTAAIIAGMERATLSADVPGSYQVAQLANVPLPAPGVPPAGPGTPSPATPPTTIEPPGQPANDNRPPNRIRRAPRPPIIPRATPWALLIGALGYGASRAIDDAAGHPDRVEGLISNLEAAAADIEARSPAAAETLRHGAADIRQDATSPYDSGRAEVIYREAVNEARTQLRSDEETEARSQRSTEVVTITRTEETEDPDPCEVGPYSVMRRKCRSRGGEAHHIVPDFSLRYGPRPPSGVHDTQRIAAAGPTLASGPAICLSGPARVAGGEHFAVHQVTDIQIHTAGARNQTLPGTTDWRTVRRASLAGIAAAKPDCLPQAAAAVNEAFEGVPPNQILRARMDYRHLPGESLDALRTGSLLIDGRPVPTRPYP